MRGFSGRFAQARGNSPFARSFNAQFKTSTARPMMFVNNNIRMSSVFTHCAGEIPINGFAEQYRSITSSFSSVGTSANSDSVSEDSDTKVVNGSLAPDEFKIVQLAEIQTLFTYCHDREDMTQIRVAIRQ